ncbi:MAG: type II toxin-antitoxin system CcdA family antitoxin [Holophaga sp.]|jgi:antitoxin CcdA
MIATFRAHAPKKAVNVSLNSDLLQIGKDLGLNISALAEAALAQAVKEALAQAWLRENADGIQAYNEHVESHAVFSDGLRSF